VDQIQTINEIKVLEVFDTVEVGPIKLEKNRITAPYLIRQGNRTDSNELIYSYDESVFNPQDESDMNLANMIAAQVALNYGLFSKQIIFNGIFDNVDRRTLRDWAENTAKEIYVNKLFNDNPFLQGEITQLEPVKLKSYLRAELFFKGIIDEPVKTKWELWDTKKDRHCILSSGGKDSLLSYGLLSEIGVETHPLFINESGRHWHTALNSFRYFKEHIPHTTKVWTNCDRIFPWFLRHMPFIRKDFSQMRSDIYPIRLWTVPVFLFGVLPLLKKRGIGRLVIGDEYDTSVRGSFRGIPHYCGLYDQSRYFDEHISRYFMKKGWNITQFSVLRPLSELLIETILTKRYPVLQEHQISCHATHIEADRVKPCGKCEKCRRIVGMLTAIGADPKKCGYSESQIEACIQSLERVHLHQEEAGASHLNHLLISAGILKVSMGSKVKAKAHPEVVSIRFDSDKSPFNVLPCDIRLPLFRIFLKYATGASKRVARKWLTFDLLKAEELNMPYPFDSEMADKTSVATDKKSSDQKILWGDLTWVDAEKRLEKMDVALLPVGAIEQHGPHLPLDVDAFDADYLAQKVAEACSDPKPLVLPMVPYGVSYHHEDFKGTLSVSNNALASFIFDIGMSAARNGINKLIIINGHGDNSPTLNYAAQMINREAKIFVAVDTGETSDVDLEDICETVNDVHAGEIETSTTLAVRPDLVKMDLAEKELLHFKSRYLNFSSLRNVPWYSRTKILSSSGVMGDPTKATVDKGKKAWAMMIAHLVALVEDLRNLDHNDIHQKRY